MIKESCEAATLSTWCVSRDAVGDLRFLGHSGHLHLNARQTREA